MAIRLGASGKSASARLPLSMLEVLVGGFVERDGCILFRRLASRAERTPLANFANRTGYECFINELRVEEHVAHAAATGELASVGVEYGKRVSLALESTQPRKCAVVIESEATTCTVRFHVRRSGELWVGEDLESHDIEAVMEL